MDAAVLQNLQSTHLAIWKENDPVKRIGLMTRVYSAGIRMFDPGFTLTGHQEVSDFISKLHAGGNLVNFTATAPLEATQHGARLFWAIESKNSGEIMTGMDFFIVENDLVTQLFVFIDAPKV